ncbi:hypothetical protein [Aureispira sp. CCB-QB1]|uniref:hypothetical protein n=1 Tax=Aureispira sp. CCB-QB1 TaxID=1313421 RepID=UPI000695DB3E|nr:hypothetical protein [Aureispira sp. CCB-QB1]
MRKPSAKLHQLVNSLNKEEKKRVSIRIQELGKKGVKHLRLFKMLTKQEVYNENALKKIFRGSALSLEKKRLYQLVMEALSQFHQNSTIEHELLAGLQQFHILYQKELYEQAKTKIHQLRQLAQKHEAFHYIQLINQQLIQLENKVSFFSCHTDQSFQNFVDNMLLEKEQAACATHYSILKTQIHYLFKKKKLSPDYIHQMEQLLQHDLLTSFNQANSITSHLHFLQIHSTYSFLKTDYPQSLQYSIQALELFEKHFKTIRTAEEYMDYLQNACTAAQYNKDHKLVAELFEKIDQNNLTIQAERDRYELRTIEMKANWYIGIQDIDSGLQLINQNTAWLEHSKLDTCAVYYCFVILSLMIKNYDHALTFLDVVLKKDNKKKKLTAPALLLKLCIYFDTQEFSLLESHVRSIQRKFNLDKKNHQVELIVVNGFRQLLQAKPSEILLILKKLHQQLSDFQTNATHTEQRTIQMSWILTWIKHKINQTPHSKAKNW